MSDWIEGFDLDFTLFSESEVSEVRHMFKNKEDFFQNLLEFTARDIATKLKNVDTSNKSEKDLEMYINNLSGIILQRISLPIYFPSECKQAMTVPPKKDVGASNIDESISKIHSKLQEKLKVLNVLTDELNSSILKISMARSSSNITTAELFSTSACSPALPSSATCVLQSPTSSPPHPHETSKRTPDKLHNSLDLSLTSLNASAFLPTFHSNTEHTPAFSSPTCLGSGSQQLLPLSIPASSTSDSSFSSSSSDSSSASSFSSTESFSHSPSPSLSLLPDHPSPSLISHSPPPPPPPSLPPPPTLTGSVDEDSLSPRNDEERKAIESIRMWNRHLPEKSVVYKIREKLTILRRAEKEKLWEGD